MKTLFLLRSLTLCAVALGAVVAAALALPDTGAAHLDIRPRVLESGGEATLLIELPQLRRDLLPTGLDVSGSGLEQLSSRLLSRAGLESRWRVRVRISAPPGPLVVSLRARFDGDGPQVITQTLTVVPAREESTSWAMVAVATAALGAASLAALLLLRRRRAA